MVEKQPWQICYISNFLGDQTEVFHQDDFHLLNELNAFLNDPAHMKYPELKHINWEIDSGFNNSKLLNLIKKKLD